MKSFIRESKSRALLSYINELKENMAWLEPVRVVISFPEMDSEGNKQTRVLRSIKLEGRMRQRVRWIFLLVRRKPTLLASEFVLQVRGFGGIVFLSRGSVPALPALLAQCCGCLPVHVPRPYYHVMESEIPYWWLVTANFAFSTLPRATAAWGANTHIFFCLPDKLLCKITFFFSLQKLSSQIYEMILLWR